MIIGSDKGYIYPYDIMTDVKNKKVIYFPLNIFYSKLSILKMRAESVGQPK